LSCVVGPGYHPGKVCKTLLQFEPHWPKAKTGRPPVAIEIMLRIVNDLLANKGLLLKSGTAVDAMLISAPSSTKRVEGKCDTEMHQAKKGKLFKSTENPLSKRLTSILLESPMTKADGLAVRPMN
jgi:hypothetical protein